MGFKCDFPVLLLQTIKLPACLKEEEEEEEDEGEEESVCSCVQKGNQFPVSTTIAVYQ